MRFRAFALLGSLATIGLAGCQTLLPEQTPPPVPIVEPAPGYVRIVSMPAAPTVPVEIRFHAVGPGGASRDFFEFAVNEKVLIVFPGVPPTSSSLQVNGVRCAGQWAFEPNVEIDVVLSFAGSSCKIDVAGKHTFGEVHTEPGKDSGLRGN